MNPLLKLPLCACAVLACLTIPAVAAPDAASRPPAAKNIKVSTAWDLKRSGWTIPLPPYPYQAMRHREQGAVYAELTTDAKGKVITARTAKATKHPTLDASFVTWAKTRWRGPPNVTVITSFTYQLR